MGKVNEAVDQLTAKTKLPRSVVFNLVVGAIFAAALAVMLVLGKGSLGLALAVASVVIALASEWLLARGSNGAHAFDLVAALYRAAPGVALGVLAMLLGMGLGSVHSLSSGLTV